MMALAFIAPLFLREIPLRKSDKTSESEPAPAPVEVGQ